MADPSLSKLSLQDAVTAAFTGLAPKQQRVARFMASNEALIAFVRRRDRAAARRRSRHRGQALARARLLTHDLRIDDRDLRLGGSTQQCEPALDQLALPGLDPPPVRKPRRPSRPKPASAFPPAGDQLLDTFLRRLAVHGRAKKGRKAYAYQMRSMLLIGARLAGHPVTWADLIRNENLLGLVLVDETAPTLGTRLSKWTLAQRRSAIRDFFTLMRPELLGLVGEEPHDRLDRALRTVAERVGTGYRLTGGAPRQRGGQALSALQIRDVIDAAGRESGYRGARNRAFFTILAETGARVNALRQLDGADCVEMPSGRLRIFLHEKGKAEAREIELSHAAAAALRFYAEAFNYLATFRRWRERICLGEQGPVWRNSPRGCWSYHDILATLRAACQTPEAPTLTPHALRRAFATDAASVLPRHVVAQAGGWKGLERLDDHYVQPRGATIAEKLDRAAEPFCRDERAEDEQRIPARAL